MLKLKPEYINTEIFSKGWGYEVWVCNHEKYCLKKLVFNDKAKFSMHYHLIKDETWYIEDGEYIFRWIDTTNANINEKILKKGDTVRIPPGMPHQIESIEKGTILEVSTEHFDYDNYRVFKGDSQKKI
jgi:mannose-6-phosphate isomerase-like protein (cupin superfamily)